MTTQVLYRKWRPQRFAEVVGQEPITRTLRQAVARGRIAHAYLFAGPRGTGKTTTARILAKAVNCLQPQEGEPCNACPPCTAINEGRFMDLVEMDAASHRGIDDIRELQDRIIRTPAEGRYKVYIVDEAHQLTLHAFNALLKTLEEPPPHAIFVLCTTEPHNMPPTILSRCQRYDFRRISLRATAGRLAEIARGEGIQAPQEALRLLARQAQGSLRDACNLLEQATLYFGPSFGPEEVRGMLGLSGAEGAWQLAGHALRGRLAQGLALLARITSLGGDLQALHREVVDYLRAVMLLKAGATEEVDLPPELAQEAEELARSVTWEQVLRAVRAFGSVSLRGEVASPLPLELALADCAPAPEPAQAPAAPETAGGPEATAPQELGPALAAQASPLGEAQWQALRRALKGVRGKRRLDVGALLNSCASRYLEGGELVLVYRSRSNLERLQEELEDPVCRQQVQRAIRQCLEADYPLRLVMAQDRRENNAGDYLVRFAQALGGRIIEVKEVPDEQTSPEAGPATPGPPQ